MKIARRNRRPSALHTAASMVRAIGFEPSGGREDDRRTTRYEPRFSATLPSSTDPYQAWLDRREQDRTRGDDARVRWVFDGPLLDSKTSTNTSRRGAHTDR